METTDKTWHFAIGVILIAVLILAGGLGFIVLPIVQGQSAGLSSFIAICRSIGLRPGSPAQQTPSSHAVASPVSRVSWDPKTLDELFEGHAADGAKLAEEVCGACHFPDGGSAGPTIPRMAGQSSFAIYKQLHDFKTGARVNETMTAIVKPLTDQQIADVAVYYGRLHQGPYLYNPWDVPDRVVQLVAIGDSQRAIPPCGACHDGHAGGPIETPNLTGQYPAYIAAQLQAFAKGDRKNDVFQRMRAIAGKLSPEEISALSGYYGTPR